MKWLRLWFHSKAAIWISSWSIYKHIYQSRFFGYPDMLLNLHLNLNRYSRWSPTRVISTPAKISVFPISSKMSFGLLNYCYDMILRRKWYFYLLQVGFHLLAVVGGLVQKIGKRQNKRRNNTRNNTKTIQNKEYTKNKTKAQEKQTKNIKKRKSIN